MQDILLESLSGFLGEHCSMAALRRYEGGASTADLWSQINAQGYADALVSEALDGAGLNLRDTRALVVLLGKIPAPVPLAETMVARALLGSAANAVPSGAIVLATPTRTEAGELFQSAVPLARSAEFALLELDDRLLLTPLRDAEVTATGVHASLAADIRWHNRPTAIIEVPIADTVLGGAGTTGNLREIAAALRAAQMVGAMKGVLEMTMEYASLRKQFGRSLAQFQAIQQQLAVMAELVLGADMAVQLAFSSTGVVPQPLLAAVAKQSASAAASRVAAMAHAIHGAIGFSEEYDLQMHTRHLYEWRMADGSETYWAGRIGAARFEASGNSVDFIRQQLSPTSTAGNLHD